jgi:F-spondin, putative
LVNNITLLLQLAPINALTTFASNPSSLLSTQQTFSSSNTELSNLQHGHLDQPIIDCVVTPWGEWSPCSKTCGNNGRMTRRRMIKLNPQNGGKPCPKKLVQRRKCPAMPPCRSF